MPRIDNAEIVSMRRDRKGFKLGDDTWYSSFNAIKNVERGDVVSFEFVTKGSFNNIKGDVSVGEGGGTTSASDKGTSGGSSWVKSAPKKFPVAVDDSVRAINRQSAVAQATAAMKDRFTDAKLQKMPADEYTEHVIEMARFYEAYTTGDIDVELGTAMAEAESTDES